MKQRHSIKETTATNGPGGTVSHKIQVSLKLLEEGMRCLHNSIASINNDYLEDIELCTLLTIVVENLHVVSHFKDETFTALPYSQDFGIITNQLFYSWKILLSCSPQHHRARKCQLYICDRYLQSRSTPRLKVLWKNREWKRKRGQWGFFLALLLKGPLVKERRRNELVFTDNVSNVRAHLMARQQRHWRQVRFLWGKK